MLARVLLRSLISKRIPRSLFHGGESKRYGSAAASSPGRGRDRKVAILGAAGRIGQHLSLLMKLHPEVSDLALYDVSPSTLPVASYVSNLATRTKVMGYVGEEQLGKALDHSDLVIVTAGVPEPEMNGGNFSPLFSTNAGILIPLCTAITKHSPLAVVLVVSNPQYSLPIAMKIFRNAGTYHWTRLFGVLSDHAGAHPFGDTLANEDLRVLIERTDDEGIELVQGTSGDAISIAYAGAMTADAHLSRLNDYDGIGFPFRGTSTGYHIMQQYSAPMSGLEPSETFPSDWDEVTMEELEEAGQRLQDKWGQDFDLDKHYPFLSKLPI